MKYIKVLTAVNLIFSLNLFAQEATTIVENTRTKERIASYCLQIEKNVCQQLEIRLESKNAVKVLKTYYSNVQSINDELLQDVYSHKTELSLKSRYEVLRLSRKICDISNENYASRWYCVLKSALFYGVGGLGALSGIGAAPLFFINAGVASAVHGVQYSGQALLLPFGFVGDIFRAFTVLPVKKVNSFFKTRKFKKKVYPLIGEFSPSESTGKSMGEVIRINNSTFQKLKEVFQVKQHHFDRPDDFNYDLRKISEGLTNTFIFDNNSCSAHIKNFAENAFSGYPVESHLIKRIKNKKQIYDLYMMNLALSNIRANKVYIEGVAHNSYELNFEPGIVDYLSVDSKSDDFVYFKGKERLKKLAKFINRYYKDFYEEWIAINGDDIPWELIQKHKDGFKVKELVNAYRFIEKSNILCYDLKIDEGLKDLAHIILGVHFSTLDKAENE